MTQRLDVASETERTISLGASSIRSIRCRTVATGHFGQKHHVRDLTPFGTGNDEQVSLLSDESVPNPSEALLAALGSCLCIAIHASAVARCIPIRSLEVDVSGELDFGAVWGSGTANPSTPGFDALSIKVTIQADAPRETLKLIVDHATLWSPVGNTLHNPVHLDVILT